MEAKKPVLIMGIDPSSRKLAIIVTDTANPPNVLEKHVILMPPKKEDVTCGIVLRRFHPLLSAYQKMGYDVRVFIEKEVSVHGKGGAGAVIPQAEVMGVVLAVCYNLGVPVMKVENKTWKMSIVGNGNASKPQIAAWCSEYWKNAYDLANGDQDLIDASGINRYGKKLYPRKRIRRSS